jgi:spore maturation protein CgeB
MLSELRPGASHGDQTTTRTFEIPAIGSFMLHERTEEVKQYYIDGAECAMFSNSNEMVAKIAHYLEHADERRRVAMAGHQRCLTSGYSIDKQAATIITKARELIEKAGVRGDERSLRL